MKFAPGGAGFELKATGDSDQLPQSAMKRLAAACAAKCISAVDCWQLPCAQLAQQSALAWM